MTEQSFTIAGGDYEQAGWASRSLKDQLKRIGAAPELIRRVMIAAYEAEMNVVIHANGGTMRALLSEDRVDVEVADHGPGIADIPLAMTEGYTTAPPRARELGFGAGLGLPNIKRNSDRFTIESTVGVGTKICFTTFLRPQEAGGVARNSIRIAAERCDRCLACLHACPTRAIRVRCGGPVILDYLCVDCTACIASCQPGALTAGPVGSTGQLHAAADTVLVVPPPLVARINPGAETPAVLDRLRGLGFGEVRLTAPAEQALRAAVIQYAASRSADGLPVVSPVCPAVLNLIATKFPSLLDQVAPFLSPLEATREQLAGRRVVFLALCPAQVTVLQTGRGPARADIILPAALADAVGAPLAFSPTRPTLTPAPLQSRGQENLAPADDTDNPVSGSIAATANRAVLRVAGMRHVVNVLEMIENGLVREPAVLELYACDRGCFGSPLLGEEASYSHRRGPEPAEGALSGSTEKPICRKAPLASRPGLRLDDDMASAIRKLAEIDRVLRTLPGKDCGRCGCPTCATLAEDIVLARATRDACVHLNGARQREEERNRP